jgi:hypothetical protein
MPSMIDDHKLTLGPGPMDLPRGGERTSNIEATVDEYCRNVCQPAGLAQQCGVIEPSIMPPIVRDQTREP